MGETIEDLLHFCRTMYSMKVDNAEYALLTAIVIFSGKFYSELFWNGLLLIQEGADEHFANTYCLREKICLFY